MARTGASYQRARSSDVRRLPLCGYDSRFVAGIVAELPLESLCPFPTDPLPCPSVSSLSYIPLQARALVVGHSPLMRRYLPASLISQLVTAEMALQG
jgi:hypothetical protein